MDFESECDVPDVDLVAEGAITTLLPKQSKGEHEKAYNNFQ